MRRGSSRARLQVQVVQGERSGRERSVPKARIGVTRTCQFMARRAREKMSSTVVRPVKTGVFSRRQTCRGKSQKPRSSDSRVAGNQSREAYRQGLLGETTSHRAVMTDVDVASKMTSSEGRARNGRGKAAWGAEI